MSQLARVQRYFQSRFKHLDGREFFGQILDIPDTARVTNFLTARRYLRTSPKSGVSPRDVVVIGGVKYIVGEHGDGFYIDKIYRHFKLFKVDFIAELSSAQRVVDPVSGILELTHGASDGDIYMSVQPTNSVTDRVEIPTSQRVVVSNYPLAIDDRVGNFIVVKTDPQLGLTVATLKEV